MAGKKAADFKLEKLMIVINRNLLLPEKEA
jgi:hypothetical protein